MELDKLIDQFKNQTMQETGTYTEPEDNAFDAPIPGQSLTDEPGNYPWEHAPQIRNSSPLNEGKAFRYLR